MRRRVIYRASQRVQAKGMHGLSEFGLRKMAELAVPPQPGPRLLLSSVWPEKHMQLSLPNATFLHRAGLVGLHVAYKHALSVP